MPVDHVALDYCNEDFHLSSWISIRYRVINFLIRHFNIGCCEWDVLLNLPLHRVSKLAGGHFWDFHHTNNHSSRSTDGDDSFAGANSAFGNHLLEELTHALGVLNDALNNESFRGTLTRQPSHLQICA